MDRRAAGRAGGIIAAVPAALFVALAGTALHRQGLVMADVVLPLGVVAALLLLGSVQVFLGAMFRSVVPVAVSGLLCYAMVGWWSTMEPGKRLIAGDLAGILWVYGIAAVTVAMLAWCRRYRASPASL